MNSPIVLMLHVGFGMLCLLGALWVFVDTIHAAEAHLGRIRAVSWVVAAAMWAAYLIAGCWYIFDYPRDKAIILKGPWPASHTFFMETKEHLVIMLLLLATYLPIAARGSLATRASARRLVLWTSGAIAALALVADSFGAVIAMGVKVALFPR